MKNSLFRSNSSAAVQSAEVLAIPQIDSIPYLAAAVPVGLVGAGVVAFCVLIVDLITQQAFATPSALGAVLFLGEPFRIDAAIRPVLVVGYTLIHTATFIAAAAGAVSAEYTLSRKRVALPIQLASGVLGIFLGLQVVFGALTFLLEIAWIGELGFERIVVANVIAAFSMALIVYLRGTGRAAARSRAQAR